MTSNMLVKEGQCFSWDFSFPTLNSHKDSPVFEFMNLKLIIRFHVYSQNGRNFISIFLINCSETFPLKSFEITTYIEYAYKYQWYKPYKCSRLEIKSSSSTVLWIETQDLAKKHLYLPSDVYSKDCSDLTITCVIFSPINVKSLIEKGDNSTQTTSKLCECKTEYSDDKDADNSNKSSPETHEKYLSNLESLSEDLDSILSNSVMADINIKCEEVIVAAHKAVLAARSDVFTTILKKHELESTISTINIEDIDPPTLQVFLKYLYTGKLPHDLSDDIFHKLYLTSFNYAVLELQKECSVLMAKYLSKDNFIQLLKTAESQADVDLKDIIADFISKNPLLLKSESWIGFSDEFPLLAIEIYKKYVGKSLP